MILKWLFSKTVREALAMRKHVWKLLSAQRDLLSPQAIGGVMLAMSELDTAIRDGANKGRIRIKMEELEFAANQWFKPYPHTAWRENIEVLLVALAVAMGIRTFFLQPFKIPTGSMQPTLFGITSANLVNEPDFKIPYGLDRLWSWVKGDSYVHVVAEADGAFEGAGPPLRFLIFNIKQTLMVGGHAYTIWFPPDFGGETLMQRADLVQRLPDGRIAGRFFRKGQDIVKLRVRAGDHLFVDRLSYNFRRPRRGEIVVFETRGINPDERRLLNIPGDQFYIKRLVGLGGETLSLHQDYTVKNAPTPDGTPGDMPVGHLVVNGQPLSAATPHFENLYTFYGAKSGTNVLGYAPNHYFGHALVANLGSGRSFTVRTNHYFVMGDNTMSSLDARYFGDLPEQYVIGKSWFVYWPISRRFGWGYR